MLRITTAHHEEEAMLEAQSDQIVQRAGICAMGYYPEISVDSPDYSVWAEADWCLEGVALDDPSTAEMLRAIVARTIIDPTEHREELTDFCSDLVEAARTTA